MLDWNRFIAGFVSGFTFQLLHPLDLIRIRFQASSQSKFTNVPRYSSYLNLLSNVRKTEGIRSLYKGVLFSIIPNASFGFFMMFNHFVKTKLQQMTFFKENLSLTLLCSSILSSLCISAVFNPLYVIKTWKVIDLNEFDNRQSLSTICKSIKNRNGYFGFMKGYSMMLVTAANGSITLAIIDSFKHNFPLYYDNGFGTFLVSGLARVCSSSLLYPFSTIRTRISQNQHFTELSEPRYMGVADCYRKIVAEEGFQALYQGIGANSLKAFISSGVLFFIYEGTYNYLKKRNYYSL